MAAAYRYGGKREQPTALAAVLDGTHEDAMSKYRSLETALEKYFNEPYEKLPPRLSKRVDDGFFGTWDSLNSYQRRHCAKNIDFRNDPAYETDKRFDWDLYDQLEKNQQELLQRGSTDRMSATVDEIKKESLMLKKLIEVNRANAKAIGQLRWLRSDNKKIGYWDAVEELQALLESLPANDGQRIDRYESLYRIQDAIDKKIGLLDVNGSPQERDEAKHYKSQLDSLLSEEKPQVPDNPANRGEALYRETIPQSVWENPNPTERIRDPDSVREYLDVYVDFKIIQNREKKKKIKRTKVTNTQIANILQKDYQARKEQDRPSRVNFKNLKEFLRGIREVAQRNKLPWDDL